MRANKSKRKIPDVSSYTAKIPFVITITLVRLQAHHTQMHVSGEESVTLQITARPPCPMMRHLGQDVPN
jgi:hypothetical protein